MRYILFVLTIFFLGCNKEKNTQPIDIQPIISIYNCNLISEKASICYDSLINDSRCPEDVVCVWSGNVKVALSLKQGNINFPFQITNNKDTTINGIKIKLLDVMPYPKFSAPYNVKESKVKLAITF
jgi:hypothetical protein